MIFLRVLLSLPSNENSADKSPQKSHVDQARQGNKDHGAKDDIGPDVDVVAV
jgi:hypothetical protein